MRKTDFILVAVITFALSFLVSVITINIYSSYINPAPKFYAFDLFSVVKAEQDYLMKHKKYDVGKSLEKYFHEVNDYLSNYQKDGIVLVKGATVGVSPFIRDITDGFIKNHPPVGVKKESENE